VKVAGGGGEADVHDGSFVAEGAVAAVEAEVAGADVGHVWSRRRSWEGEVDDEAGCFAVAGACVGSSGWFCLCHC
jgi:hypothetical protein